MENITELDNKKMKVVQEMAEINMLISKGKAELHAMESEKERFFTQRENEVLGRIHKLLNNSRILFEETQANYDNVHEFYEVIKGFGDYVHEAHEGLNGLVSDFQKHRESVEQDLETKEEEIAKLRKEVQRDREEIEREKTHIKSKKKELESIAKKIDSERSALKVAYKIMKETHGQ